MKVGEFHRSSAVNTIEYVSTGTYNGLHFTRKFWKKGAGDIADCRDLSGAEATAKLLDQIPGAVMAVGDLAYPDGTKENFECYDRTWGRQKTRTRPAPGNHEFHSSAATPYFDYFGSVAGAPGDGYYSYELGAWHIVVLNSECVDVGGCGPSSRQGKWLRADLAAHPVSCTLAYWHKPLFSSGGAHGNDAEVTPLWQALYECGRRFGHRVDTITITSVSRRRILRESLIPLMAFASSSSASAAKISLHLVRQNPIAKCTITKPLASSSSRFERAVTIGNSFLKWVKPSPIPVAPLVT